LCVSHIPLTLGDCHQGLSCPFLASSDALTSLKPNLVPAGPTNRRDSYFSDTPFCAPLISQAVSVARFCLGEYSIMPRYIDEASLDVVVRCKACAV
jgi:hypothetical protein